MWQLWNSAFNIYVSLSDLCGFLMSVYILELQMLFFFALG